MKFFWTLPLALSLFLAACNRSPDTSSQPTRQNGALGFRIEIKADGAGSFTAMNQVTFGPEADRLAIKASGTDPSIALPALKVRPGAQIAIRVDQTAPADTLIEVYYTTTATPVFTAEHVVSVPVKAGRSVVMFEINDPDFAGGLRFDPGQLPGDYSLHQVEVFSSEPIAFGS
jgi:hypothetical protein